MKDYIKKKELETCHAAQELLLLAVVLDRMVGESSDMINADSVEVMCRRVYALWKAFEDVHKVSDWRQPRGQAKWKSKVKWHLAEEYDALSLEAAELSIDEADDEVRERMKKKALYHKFTQPTGSNDVEGFADE